MVGEACLPSNAYYPRMSDYTLCSGVHVCWSEHSDSSFVYGFMILDYGFGTMTATTLFLCRHIFSTNMCVYRYICICAPVRTLCMCITYRHACVIPQGYENTDTIETIETRVLILIRFSFAADTKYKYDVSKF